MKVVLSLSFLSLTLVSSLAHGQESSPSTSPPNFQPLEIRLAKPLSWKGNCLDVNIVRVNHSKSRIFLPPTPFEGVQIYSSVVDPTNGLGQGAGATWLLVYGWTDVIYHDAKSLAPGAAKHDSYCIAATSPVKDTEKKNLRQVPVRGRLRILADFYQEVSNQKSVTSRGSNSDGLRNARVVIEIPIPCREGVEQTECATPPPIFPGERYIYAIDPPEPPW